MSLRWCRWDGYIKQSSNTSHGVTTTYVPCHYYTKTLSPWYSHNGSNTISTLSSDNINRTSTNTPSMIRSVNSKVARGTAGVGCEKTGSTPVLNIFRWITKAQARCWKGWCHYDGWGNDVYEPLNKWKMVWPAKTHVGRGMGGVKEILRYCQRSWSKTGPLLGWGSFFLPIYICTRNVQNPSRTRQEVYGGGASNFFATNYYHGSLVNAVNVCM